MMLPQEDCLWIFSPLDNNGGNHCIPPHGMSKDIDKIPLIELVGNLQTYELGLTRIGKSSKSKSMALMAKSSDTDESLDDEDSKMKSYITR